MSESRTRRHLRQHSIDTRSNEKPFKLTRSTSRNASKQKCR